MIKIKGLLNKLMGIWYEYDEPDEIPNSIKLIHAGCQYQRQCEKGI